MKRKYGLPSRILVGEGYTVYEAGDGFVISDTSMLLAVIKRRPS
jgi:hypothetical protein